MNHPVPDPAGGGADSVTEFPHGGVEETTPVKRLASSPKGSPETQAAGNNSDPADIKYKDSLPRLPLISEEIKARLEEFDHNKVHIAGIVCPVPKAEAKAAQHALQHTGNGPVFIVCQRQTGV